jgi:WD40 repeat protein
MKIKIKPRYLIIVTLSIVLIAMYFFIQYRQTAGVVDMLSISTDGRYVVSSDEKEYVILWDLEKHTKKIINRKAHIWAAYFIPNTHDYVWQDQAMNLHVENIETGAIETIPLDFYSYGLAMTRDHRYFMSGDIAEGLHWCENKQCHILKKPWSDNPREFISDMPYILRILPNDNEVIGSKMTGAGAIPKYAVGVKLWDIKTGQKLREYFGNVVQTFATISPDGKYVVAGDVDSWQLVWDTTTGHRLVSIFTGEPVLKIEKSGPIITDHNILPLPKDLYSASIISINYIDSDHYLVFTNQNHYAILYQTLNPKPLKYLDIGTNPWPATFNLERDQSMDTSPSAHVLVMAKDQEPGIMVYHYDPANQTLTKVWDGK